MSNRSVKEDGVEVYVATYKLAGERQKGSPSPPKENIETDSDISSDSSSTSRKQLKSPHTVLKDAPSESPERSRSISPTSSQNEDRAEHLHRLLQEAEQSLSCRDVLITMLQKQLKKIENLYKQSIDDTQDIRYKYCLTTQELSNLRTICERYREDIATLLKDKDACCTKKELQKLQKEAEYWKTQYENLLKQVQVMENTDIATENKISKEIQVESVQDHDLKIDVDILKDQYASIKNCLQQQSEKMEFIVGKLQKDVQQPDDAQRKLEKELTGIPDHSVNITEKPWSHTCTDIFWSENPNLLRKFENLTESAQLNNKYVMHDDPSQLLSSQKLNDSDEIVLLESLKTEVKSLKIEIEQLKENNTDLQNKVNEVDKLKEENADLKNKLYDKEIMAPFYFSSSPVDVKDSLVENLRKENEDLRSEVEMLKHILNAPNDNVPKIYIQPEISDDYDTDNSSQVKSRQGSRVSFSVPNDQLQSELLKMHQENEDLKLKMKQIQGEGRNSDELEKMTVELVNLRRQLKQKQEDMDRLTHEAETIASRKNAIIREFQHANKLLKSDYEELLKMKAKFTLDNQTDEIIEKGASMGTAEFETKVNCDKDYEKVVEENDKIKSELNDKTLELNAIRNELDTKAEDVSQKERVIHSLYIEIDKLQKQLHNSSDYEKISEENRKIRDEINNVTKELSTISSNLQKKTAEIIEKERTIKSQIAEMTQLKATIVNNNAALRNQDKIKNELDDKIKEDSAKIQDLQTNINELQAKLTKEIQDNGSNTKELQYHKNNCQGTIENLKTELSELIPLTEKLKQENESLKSQRDIMKNTVEQYKEEAEFKKLENEKLRRNEEQLQAAMSSIQRHSENIAREYSKEKEINKTLSEKGSNSGNKSQSKAIELNNEIGELKNLLQQKDEEIKKLKVENNKVTKELETTKSQHKKDLNVHEKSLNEIKFLFKNKEVALISAVKELQEHQRNLQELEEENNKLKELLQEKAERQENEENSSLRSLKQTTDIKILEEKYNNEKMKNSELNIVVNNMHKDVHNFKMHLGELLNNLESKLEQLKIEIKNNKCNEPIPKEGVKEMIDCIEKFNSSMLQQDSNTKLQDTYSNSTEETVNYSYYYEEVKLSDGKIEDNSKTSSCTDVDCKNKNISTKVAENSSPTSNVNKNALNCNQKFSDMTINELQIKREYLLKKVKSIDQKLNTNSLNPDHSSVTKILTPKRMSSSQSDLNSHIKTSEKASYYTCSQMDTNTEDLLFKRKHYSEKIDLINEQLKINSTTTKENKENQTCYNTKSQNTCSSASAYWKKNLEIMQQMASDLNEMKIGLTKKEEHTLQDRSLQEYNLKNCPYNNNLQLHIKDLQEKLQETYLTIKEVDELEKRLKTQYSKLGEFKKKSQIEKYELHNNVLPSTDLKEIDQDFEQPETFTKEQKMEAKNREKALDCQEYPACLTPHSTLGPEQTSDTLTQNSQNTMEEIKQDPSENICKLSNVTQNKRPSQTSIPMPIQNSQKKSKPKYPTVNTTKTDDSCIKQNAAKTSDQNPDCDLKTTCEKPTVSRLGAKAKQINPPSCTCGKTNPHYLPTSQLPVTINLPKKCNCGSNRKDASPSKNMRCNTNHRAKTVQRSGCDHRSEN